MEKSLVVGAGLAGSLLAIYLARRGQEVVVFERCDDTFSVGEKRPALNITLCERGLNALAGVGLRQAVLDLAVPARGRRVHAPDGGLAYQPYGNKGEAIYSIPRAHLNAVLLQAVRREPGVRVQFDRKCLGLDLARGIAQFEDTTSGAQVEVQADRIFGADGAYSAVRGQLQKTEHFNYSQQYWRNGGYKSLTIPALPDGSSVLEPDALHIWPRGSRMLIGFPNRDGSFTCSLLLPFTGQDSFESLPDPESLHAFFSATFPDAAGLIPGLAQQFFARPANSLLTVRSGPWSFRDRVLLIGDAAHAVLPSLGQGANAAFEDCAVLDRCLQKYPSDWRSVFAEFERLRKPNLDVLADLCIAHFEELTDLVADPKFLKRREVERTLNDLYPTLYRSLYSMVSFSDMPYADALAAEQRQQVALERLLRLPDLDQVISGPTVRRILEEAADPEAHPPAGLPGSNAADPGSIMGLAMGFWGSKVLLSAVELGVFAELHRGGARSAAALTQTLGLHGRGAADFFDSLVSLGLLQRHAELYTNAPHVECFLVPDAPTYIGGALELANVRLYPVWGKLSEALRTGAPQNEAKGETDYYGNLVSHQERLRTFLRAMSGLSMMAAEAITTRFPWREYKTFADIGGAEGALALRLARAHGHLSGLDFDLAEVQPFFEEQLAASGVADRVRFRAGDFFAEPLPQVDVLIMGHVLHNWPLVEKRVLIRKAYEALPVGGALIVYEALIDEQRQSNTFGLLMSLNMLLVTRGGFVFTGSECQAWLREAGFRETRVEHLHGSDSMVIGVK
ncbi:MAG: methyltransferase [Polyangiaceae bacterium]